MSEPLQCQCWINNHKAIHSLEKERDALQATVASLQARVEELEGECDAQAAVIKGAPWYSDIEILQREKAELEAQAAAMREALENLNGASAAALETMECRGDEDCDHCVLVGAMSDVTKALQPDAGKALLERLRLADQLIEGCGFDDYWTALAKYRAARGGGT